MFGDLLSGLFEDSIDVYREGSKWVVSGSERVETKPNTFMKVDMEREYPTKQAAIQAAREKADGRPIYIKESGSKRQL